MKDANNSYPIAAIATPPGLGALSIIRISGKCLLNIYRTLTKKKHPKPRYALLSNLYSAINNKLIDNCIIIFYKSPNSFTGEDVIEINCHGGNLIAQIIMESLIFLDVKEAMPGEFSYRSFLNNKIDLIQAESISSLVSSKTDLSHRVALQNLNGFFSNSIYETINKVQNLLTILENELNFNEDEISFLSRQSILDTLNTISISLTSLNNTSQLGKVIESGYKIVLLGRPNVGKSSLFNHLLGKNRAIVSNISGTTRDTIEGFSEIKGVPVCFIDTAGYWESPDLLESMGIEKTLKEINLADFILFVDDNNPVIQFQKFNFNINKKKLIYIKSKCDINSVSLCEKAINVSTKNGKGINQLIKTISNKFDSFDHRSPIITTQRQKNLVDKASKSLLACKKMFQNNYEIDLIVSNIHDVLFNLESITGKIANKDIISNIFKSFCIGK